MTDLMGLSQEEYELAQKILGRVPNRTELGMIAAMWSEHCSYKSSRLHLGRFPTKGERVLQGPGENAGVVDLGEGLACVFKIESHNHPSYIEPYQGAATGVGGILRDVFTMGARPIANLNSLHFGEATHPRMRYLVSGVVAGVGDYGNCVGIPTVGGQVLFHKSYTGNILVNAFTLGIVDRDKYFTARAEGIGNPIYYVGSRTGRDGIHGATMASASFDTNDPEAQEKRPTVQVGDPFTEKLLLEACLELMQTDAIIGIQDMGAAGLTSSSFEMAGRAGTGVILNLDKIPTREPNMTPYELMLSESQERMLLIVKKGREEEVKRIFQKWDLQAAEVGQVNDDGHVTLKWHGEVVAKLPAEPLTEKAPKYDRPQKKPDSLAKPSRFEPPVRISKDILGDLKKMLASPNLCSRAWVYEQYDTSVRTNTLQGPGGDAAVLRLKESKQGKGLALSCDVNPRYCYADPFVGAAYAVAEACRNLACVGALPIGLTNCLNFGNPENPEIMWQFSQAIDGMRKACLELNVPIVSGNVSFYNETDEAQIHPTPTVVAVGLLEDVKKTVGTGFRALNDVVVLLGDSKPTLSASEYLSVIHQKEAGAPPEMDWARETKVQTLCREAIGKGILHSAHDVSDGGLLIAITESALASAKQHLGADLSALKDSELGRPDEFWFGESCGRIVVTLPEKNMAALRTLAKSLDVEIRTLGHVKPEVLRFPDGRSIQEVKISELNHLWRFSFENYMEKGRFDE